MAATIPADDLARQRRNVARRAGVAAESEVAELTAAVTCWHTAAEQLELADAGHALADHGTRIVRAVDIAGTPAVLKAYGRHHPGEADTLACWADAGTPTIELLDRDDTPHSWLLTRHHNGTHPEPAAAHTALPSLLAAAHHRVERHRLDELTATITASAWWFGLDAATVTELIAALHDSTPVTLHGDPCTTNVLIDPAGRWLLLDPTGDHGPAELDQARTAIRSIDATLTGDDLDQALHDAARTARGAEPALRCDLWDIAIALELVHHTVWAQPAWRDDALRRLEHATR
jgi:hypothetical protein